MSSTSTPTSTTITINVKNEAPTDADGVVVFATDDRRLVGDAVMVLSEIEMKTAMRLIHAEVVRGKLREIDFDLIEPRPGELQRVYVCGLGQAAKITAEIVRKAAAHAMRTIRKHRLKRIALVPPIVGRGRRAVGTEAAVTGMLLAAFDYREFKGTARKQASKESSGADSSDDAAPLDHAITIVSTPEAATAVKQAAERGRLIAESQNFARTIASRPGNSVNPPELARIVQAAAKEVGLACRVLDEKEMKRLGMGGILAVGGGSVSTPPRMIVLEHRPSVGRKKTTGKKTAGKDGDARPILLVGKAITFDTGGISIKPAEKMGKMIYDKCGGMAVLGAMCAIARLKLPVHVVGILSSAENHVSDRAYRPGDILTMYNGVTVEVTNTDAEGRLVLGDALAWGIETFKPSACIDLATLTGGVITALGRTMAGVMSNSDALVAELTACGESTGEILWRLPLGPDQREQIKSDHADIVNSAGRDAHPLQGGAFLSHFIPRDDSVPWAHLDIAGVADTEKELPCYGKGATGWGVRLLVDFVDKRMAGH
jgi:leucyl aminopeptidase